jgi:hypothetical protein
VLCCIFVLQLALSVVQLEAQVTRLAELLANVISDTKGRVEKKQAQVCVQPAVRVLSLGISVGCWAILGNAKAGSEEKQAPVTSK